MTEPLAHTGTTRTRAGRCLAQIILTMALASTARTAETVDIYSHTQLETIAHGLAQKQGRFASQDLARYSNHYTLLAAREGSGSAELHEHEADIFVIESGHATLVSGGKIVNPHAQKPGEIRGTSIQGGERHALAAGDIVHIPAGTPHQLVIDKGEPFVYFVVKVTGQ